MVGDAALATESTASLPWMPLRLKIRTKVRERGIEDRMARKDWVRVTSRRKECTLEIWLTERNFLTHID